MPIDYYSGTWFCDVHDLEYTSEGICPGCYTEIQFGDTRFADGPDD